MISAHPRKTHVIAFGILLLTLMNSLSAVSSGKITGRVFDSETNEALPGANVVIEGTSLGAAADADGRYTILLPHPGKYTVAVSVIGYVQVRATEVIVQMGLTTPLDFPLTATTLEGEEVIVVAERQVIQTDVGNSGTILDGSDVVAIPVGNFKDVLDKQMGIQEMDARGLFIRGQRQNSISLRIDGLETRDNVDEVVYTRFNPDELEQVEINAGGYDASYGNATGGMINLVTKEGSQKYTGTFDYRLSAPGRKHFGPSLEHYYDEYYLKGWSDSTTMMTWVREINGSTEAFDTLVNQWEILAHNLEGTAYEAYYDRPELLKELYKHYMRDEATTYADKSDMVVSATLGGPVPLLKNTTFFTSFRREKIYYLYPGPLDHFRDQNGMVKLTTHPTQSTKLSFNFRYTETTGLNRYDYYRDEVSRGDLSASEEGQYNPDFQSEKRYIYEGVEQVAWTGYGDWPYTGRIGQSTHFRNQYGITFTHTLSPRTFYEVKLLAGNFRSYGGQCALRDTSLRVELTDPADPTYTVTLSGPDAQAPLGYWPTEIGSPIKGFISGGSYLFSERNRAKDITFRANLTSQVNRYNQLNLGFEYVTYEIKKREYRDDDTRLGRWLWHVKPRSSAFWASDKLEFEGAAITLSLRGDIRIPDEWFDWKRNLWDPIWISTDELVANDSTGSGPEGAPRYQPPLKTVLAPRLSISHPIGETAKVFFNWGHYYQDQAIERQYLYYRRDATQVRQIHYGDPELPFRKAVQYEIGYEHNIANVIRVAFSGYYKDVKNLLMDRIGYRSIGREDDNDYEYANFYTYGPNRYMSTRGLEARLEKRQGRYLTAWCNYSYQIYSRGVYGFRVFYENPDDPEAASGEFDYADENRARPSESRINAGVDFHTPRGFGPNLLGLNLVGDIDLNFLFWWRQQPTFTDNPSGAPPPYAPRDNKRWKPHWGVNMTGMKRFHIGGITPVFYVEVYNLFNTKNMWRGAFNERYGDLRKYLDALEEKGGQPGDYGDLAEEIIGNDPTTALPFNGAPWFLYLNPRQIWAGLRFELN
ncbi:MAG: carboxypeptidase-like regulatory domain-containing protein [Fidelibacterota bacterium]|nr:MAG: carboxypeptidase-like regulatory domain-containing protein [Candidatus Neomarinimicrobiota bacterium]